jgi:hypothetical protein
MMNESPTFRSLSMTMPETQEIEQQLEKIASSINFRSRTKITEMLRLVVREGIAGGRVKSRV